MNRIDTHLSDEELLLFADGEAAPGNVARTEAHLAACWDCRCRLRQLEQTIADFVEVHHRALDPQLPSSAGPRALLKARLQQLATATPPGSRPQPFHRILTWRGLAYAAAMLLVVALGTMVVLQLGGSGASARGAVSATVGPVPDHRLTPGRARLLSTSQVCKVSYSDDTREVPAEVRQQVFHEYGMVGAQEKDYELDYLISPQLGGTDDIRNLWPEPESSSAWNLRAKDALENRLHQLVCEGKINLATAQRDLANDWISAYKTYFHTDKPIQPL